MEWLSDTTSNMIYEEIFGVYSILALPNCIFKVYKRRDCVKLDKYKELRKSDEELTEDDYNEYFMVASTHNTLMHAVLWIAENNILYTSNRVIPFYQLIAEINKYVAVTK